MGPSRRIDWGRGHDLFHAAQVTVRPNLWPVAIHECGHAVARLALGLRAKSLVVERGGSGLCDFPVLYAYDDTNKQVRLRHCVAALAGVAAQRAFTQGIPTLT